ncbi:MAG TPA: thioredoxin domain-containing protein [Candidatus Sulfomarinibacteraceae bacterium]|nr:thioredoxin domain-containing protein [Candidatus Sulfomarinibacteraceae bacterium]
MGSPEGGEPRHTNRLAGETSPYLLQHAHNPVDWWPWGSDALARAKLLDRPIFLSIGYAACHWCHVMERESFEDEATAAYLNARFIPIKVDREERPDLDQVYMGAVQAMTGGGGGWPMSVFLTPEGRPFYGGTYFPDQPRHGMPSFRQVLEGVERAWREDRAGVEGAGARLAASLAETARLTGPGDPGQPGPDLLDTAVMLIERGFDAATGGWGGAPKFPQPMTIEFLLGRAAATGEPRPLAVARRALDAMAAGGIHDQLGGGFHRYATDAAWLIPHFEQMLYDNAQLARVYLHAWALTGATAYREVAAGTLDYLVRELTTEDGAFAASQDADTEGVEGATFTWRADEVRSVLGEAGVAEAAEIFAAAYGVTDGGNWEGVTILSRVRPTAELAGRFGRTASEIEAILASARGRLLEARSRRSQPARDDKAIAAWNGLAIAALADAARIIGLATDGARPGDATRYRVAAERAATTIVDRLLGPDGRLGRSWKDGRATAAGVLEDYACLADGLLALYEATFEERWFLDARRLADAVLERFADPAGGFFDTAVDHERLITRPKDVQDNATPSGGAMATHALLRLAALTGEGRYRSAAERAIAAVAPLASRYPTAFAKWLSAIDLALSDVAEVAIVGGPDEPGTRPLLAVAAAGLHPARVVALAAHPEVSAVPLMQGRARLGGAPTAYVCRSFTCQVPVTDPDALATQLRERAAAL